MSSGSVRLHAPLDKHLHDDPPPVAEAPAHSGHGAEAAANAGTAGGGRLWREGDRLMYQADGEPEAVRLVWARPLSGRGGPVSVMRAGKKREIAYLPSLDVLSEESRRLALEELALGMVLPRITRIHQVWPRFGNYYWDVETDMGRRKFLLSSPENNTMRPAGDMIIVKDVSGNCYEINPVSGLDAASLRELDRAL